MKNTNYIFKIAVDGGAAFQNEEVIFETAPSYEQAEDAAFKKLYDKYAGTVAFFKIVQWKRY